METSSESKVLEIKEKMYSLNCCKLWEKDEGGHALWPIIPGYSVAIIHHTVLIVICTQQANMHSVASDTPGNATNSGPQCC